MIEILMLINNQLLKELNHQEEANNIKIINRITNIIIDQQQDNLQEWVEDNKVQVH